MSWPTSGTQRDDRPRSHLPTCHLFSCAGGRSHRRPAPAAAGWPPSIARRTGRARSRRAARTCAKNGRVHRGGGSQDVHRHRLGARVGRTGWTGAIAATRRCHRQANGNQRHTVGNQRQPTATNGNQRHTVGSLTRCLACRSRCRSLLSTTSCPPPPVSSRS